MSVGLFDITEPLSPWNLVTRPPIVALGALTALRLVGDDMPEDASSTMDPQKRTRQDEGLAMRAQIEKLDDKSATDNSLQAVRVAVAPKVEPTSNKKKQQKPEEEDGIKTMDDLGKAPLPHGSHVFALVGLSLLAAPLWLFVVCSWVWLALLGALLPTFVVVST